MHSRVRPVALVAALLGWWLWLSPADVAAQTCTHYAAPNGSGNACTTGSPCSLSQLLTTPSPAGKVFCLKPGVYNQGIALPSGYNGTSGSRAMLKAETEGTVLINRPTGTTFDTLANWWIVEGINFQGASNNGFTARGTDNVFRKVIIWNNTQSPEPLATIVSFAGFRNVIEDCAVFGNGRYTMNFGSGSTADTNNVIRRCWSQGEGTLTSGRQVGLIVGYDGQSNVRVENFLSTYNRRPYNFGSNAEPSTHISATHDSVLYGVINYFKAGTNYPAQGLFASFRGGDFRADIGQFPFTQTNTLRDMISVSAPGTTPTKRAFDLLAADGTGNQAFNLIGINTSVGTCESGGWAGCSTQIRHFSTLAVAQSALGGSVWTASPGNCKRVVDGVLTTAPLWPWPMNQRIKDAIIQSNTYLEAEGRVARPVVDVTADLEALLGPIPTSCKTTGGNTPPGIVIDTPTTNTTWSSTTTPFSLGGSSSDDVSVASIACVSDRGQVSTDETLGIGNRWTATIPLLPGLNVITCTASDGASPPLTAPDSITVDNPITAPSAPLDFRFTATPSVNGTLTASLAWDYTQGTEPAVEFRVFRSNCLSTFAQVGADIPLATEVLTDSGLSPVGSYCWHVKAVSAANVESAASSQLRWDAPVVQPSPTLGIAGYASSDDPLRLLSIPDLQNPVNIHHPMAHKLVHWWPVVKGLEGGRTLWDLAGQGHLALINGPTWQQSARTEADGDIAFTHSTLAYMTSTKVDTGTGPMTAEVWVQEPVGADHDAFTGILGQTATSAWSSGWGLQVHDGGLGCWIQQFPAAQVSSLAAFHPTTPTHLACTWDGAAVRLYIDGVLQGTTAFAGPRTGGLPFWVGTLGLSGGPQSTWEGRISSPRLYTRALSQPEIMAARASSLARDPGLYANLPLWPVLPPQSPAQVVSSSPSHPGQRRGVMFR